MQADRRTRQGSVRGIARNCTSARNGHGCLVLGLSPQAMGASRPVHIGTGFSVLIGDSLSSRSPRSRERFDPATSSGCPQAMSAHGLRRKVERLGKSSGRHRLAVAHRPVRPETVQMHSY